ncbi:MAG TPA: hypothetical protein VEC14_02905 [Reyranellaceae bacterium]|nr:hypothetical protein [Reyranellaceae bacterium]
MDHPKFDDKRLAEIKAEVEVLNASVAKAAKERLTFDDEPATFASVMEREAPKEIGK